MTTFSCKMRRLAPDRWVNQVRREGRRPSCVETRFCYYCIETEWTEIDLGAGRIEEDEDEDLDEEEEEEEEDEEETNSAVVVEEANKKKDVVPAPVGSPSTSSSSSGSSSSSADYKDDVVVPPKVSPVAAPPSRGSPSARDDDDEDDEDFEGSGRDEGSGAGSVSGGSSTSGGDDEEDEDYDDTNGEDDVEGIDINSVITEPEPKVPVKQPEVVVVAPPTTPAKTPSRESVGMAPSPPPSQPTPAPPQPPPQQPEASTTSAPTHVDPPAGPSGSGSNDVRILDHKPDDRQGSFFAQPGILAGKSSPVVSSLSLPLSHSLVCITTQMWGTCWGVALLLLASFSPKASTRSSAMRKEKAAAAVGLFSGVGYITDQQISSLCVCLLLFSDLFADGENGRATREGSSLCGHSPRTRKLIRLRPLKRRSGGAATTWPLPPRSFPFSYANK